MSTADGKRINGPQGPRYFDAMLEEYDYRRANTMSEEHGSELDEYLGQVLDWMAYFEALEDGMGEAERPPSPRPTLGRIYKIQQRHRALAYPQFYPECEVCGRKIYISGVYSHAESHSKGAQRQDSTKSK